MAGTEQAEKNSNVELKLNSLRILAFESDGSFSEISLRLEEIVREYSRNVDELFTQLLRLTEIFRHPNGTSTQSSSKKDLQSATVQSPLSKSKVLKAKKTAKPDQQSFEKIDLKPQSSDRINLIKKSKVVMLLKKHCAFLEEKPSREVELFENEEAFGKKYSFFVNSQCYRKVNPEETIFLNPDQFEIQGTSRNSGIPENILQSTSDDEAVQSHDSDVVQDSAVDFTSSMTENCQEEIDPNAGVHFLSMSEDVPCKEQFLSNDCTEDSGIHTFLGETSSSQSLNKIVEEPTGSGKSSTSEAETNIFTRLLDRNEKNYGFVSTAESPNILENLSLLNGEIRAVDLACITLGEKEQRLETDNTNTITVEVTVDVGSNGVTNDDANTESFSKKKDKLKRKRNGSGKQDKPSKSKKSKISFDPLLELRRQERREKQLKRLAAVNENSSQESYVDREEVDLVEKRAIEVQSYENSGAVTLETSIELNMTPDIQGNKNGFDEGESYLEEDVPQVHHSNVVTMENSNIAENLREARNTFLTKDTFCVEEYCEEVFSWFFHIPLRRRFRFVSMTTNHPKWIFKKSDVCRLFLATLHLANKGNDLFFPLSISLSLK